MYSHVVLMEIKNHQIRITANEMNDLRWSMHHKVNSEVIHALLCFVHAKSDQGKENGFTKLSKLT